MASSVWPWWIFLLRQRPSRAKSKYSLEGNQPGCKLGCNHYMAHETWDHALERARLHHCFCCCWIHLRRIAAEDGRAVDLQPFFGHAQRSNFHHRLESDRVHVCTTLNLDLDLEAHRHLHAPAGQVVRPHQVTHAVRPARDPLQDLQSQSDGRFPRSILANQKHRRLAQRQIEVLQAAEVVDLQAPYHKSVSQENDTAPHCHRSRKRRTSCPLTPILPPDRAGTASA